LRTRSVLKYVLGGTIGAQPAVGRHRRHPRHLHAGRLRARRDRLHAEEERGARDEHELRHLRPRLRRFLFVGFPLAFGGFSYPGYFGLDTPMNADPLIGSGDWPSSGRAGITSVTRPRRRCSASSSTWWPSWTPWPRSRPARWPSAGSGRASSSGASSAAPSTTRCSRLDLGRRLARQAGTPWASVSATSTSPAPASCTRSAAWPPSPVPSCSAPHRQVTAPTATCHPRPQHPDGHARLLHPAVRLVRLQRRLDLRRDRHPVRHRRHQHGHRRRVGAVVAMFWMTPSGPASPTRHDGQRHARRPRGHHRPCAFVDPWAAAVIGAIAAVLVIEFAFFSTARASTTRWAPSRCTASAALRRAVRRHLRQRQVRRRLEPVDDSEGPRDQGPLRRGSASSAPSCSAWSSSGP
jgi:hypothetical protein